MRLSLGSSGPIVQQVPHPSTLLLGYKGVAIGDAVTVDGRAGKVLEYRKRGLVRVEYEDGDGATADVDASTVEVVTPVAAIDVTESFSDAQEKAAAPLDDCFLELPPDQLAEISAMIKFEAPSAEALSPRGLFL